MSNMKSICEQHGLIHAWDDDQYDGSMPIRECKNCHRKEKHIETKPMVDAVWEWVAIDF